MSLCMHTVQSKGISIAMTYRSPLDLHKRALNSKNQQFIMQCSITVCGYIIQIALHSRKGLVAHKGCKPNNSWAAGKEDSTKPYNQMRETERERVVLSAPHVRWCYFTIIPCQDWE